MSARTERNAAEARNLMERLRVKRERLIDDLMRTETRFRAARKMVARYERRAGVGARTGGEKVPTPQAQGDGPKPDAVLGSSGAVAVTPPHRSPICPEAFDLPGFLRRGREAQDAVNQAIQGATADEAARAEILAQQTERQKAKARARVDKMLAKKRGDTKRMPLQGRDALRAIRGDDQ